MRVARIFRYVLIGVPILLVALVVGAVVVLKYADFNQYKPLIAEEVRKATGRDLAISGDLRLDISLTPGIVVEDVTLSNAEWGSRPDMVSVRRLEVQIALTSLIFGVLEIKRIELTGADILFEFDRLGRANFEFEAPKTEASEKKPEDMVEGSGGVGAIPVIHEVMIRDSRITYRGVEVDATFRTDVDTFTLRSDGPDDPLRVVYAGSYNDAPVKANATLGAPADLFEADKPWPVDSMFEAGGATVTVKGTIAKVLTVRGLDLVIAVRGDQLGDLSEFAGWEVPPLGAYSLSTRLTGDPASTITLAGLKAQLGDSDVAGEVTFMLADEGPVVNAKLASRKIDLAALDTGVNVPMQDVISVYSVKDGKLDIESFKANLSGATITIKGTIADSAEGKSLNLAVEVAGDQTSDLSELAGVEVPALGAYFLSTRVTSDIVSVIKLVGLEAQIGTSDLAGEVTVAPGGERPAIDAKLASRQIDLAALGAGVDANLQDTVTALSLTEGKLDITSLRTSLAGATVTVNGTIADAARFEGLDLAVAARGGRFGDLSELVGGKMPALGSYAISTRVTGDLASTINITELAAQLGGSDISGDAKMTLSGKHPAVDARLASDTIDLAALGAGNAPLQGTVAIFSLKDKKLFIKSIESNLSGATIIVGGTIAEPAKVRGLDLSVAAKGEQFGDLSALVGGKMPALGPYTISTRVTGDPATTIELTALKAQVGESDLAGEAQVTLTGARPFIDAGLSSNTIDLAILGSAAGDGDGDGVGQQKAAKKPDRIFPDDPLPLEGLRAINADLRFDAATVTGRGPPLRNAVVILSLRGGLLNVEPFKAELYKGTLDGAVQIDAREETAGLVARATLRKVDLGPVLEGTALGGAVEGQVNFDFDVTGQGNSVRRIMAGLDGKVSLAMGSGRIKSRTLQTGVGGPTQVLSNALTLNVGGYTAVNCALGAFDIEKGIATSRGTLLDTDVAVFVGEGTVNLGTEVLALIIRPQVKKATLSAAVPVHIRGTLANPAYSADRTAVARRVGGLLGGLVFPPALILGLGELGTFKDGDCAGRAESADGKTTPEQTQPTTEQQPSNLPGKIIKGTGETITKGLRKLFGQ